MASHDKKKEILFSDFFATQVISLLLKCLISVNQHQHHICTQVFQAATILVAMETLKKATVIIVNCCINSELTNLSWASGFCSISALDRMSHRLPVEVRPSKN